MDPQKELDGMQQKNILLEAKNTEYAELIEKYAMAKMEHRIAYRTTVIDLKKQGEAVTTMLALAKGDPVVAKLEYTMIVAEGVMKANRESMADLRTAIDSYRSRLAWIKAEMFRTE